VIGAIAVHPFIVAAGVILFVAALVFGGHSVREEPPPGPERAPRVRAARAIAACAVGMSLVAWALTPLLLLALTSESALGGVLATATFAAVPLALALAPLARRLARRAGDPVARRIASLAGPVSVLALVLMLGMIALLIQIARTVS